MIDLSRIYTIESSNNPKAFNKKSKAAGLGQITPIVLEDWNKKHPDKQLKQKDLLDKQTNMTVSEWYMNQRIPELLNNFKIQDTVQNRLISYDWGIGNLIDVLNGTQKLPKETRDYLIKYDLGGDVKAGQKKLKELGFDPGPIDGIVGKKTITAFEKSKVSKKSFGIQNLKQPDILDSVPAQQERKLLGITKEQQRAGI